MAGEKGMLQVYTGEGKGKTSAAMGLCVRALGAGMKVLVLQFIKDGSSSEFKALSKHENFSMRAFGQGRFVKGKPSQEDLAAAKEGLAFAAQALKSGDFDLVVLDEANCALAAGLIGIQELLSALKGRHARTEVVSTGRGAPKELLDAADLVTEMLCRKHYYSQGLDARLGIEL